jgi:hypothetical protein
MTVYRKRADVKQQGLPGRHPQLPFDQVESVDKFGYRVLDLEPGVHLHEEEVIRRVPGHDELHSPCPHVPHGSRRRHGSGTHHGTLGGCEQR